ncbi:MAG: DICT sensory domain-containing protein [Actinomycetes bacterium]
MTGLRGGTPFELVASAAPTHPVTKRELVAVSRTIEREALADPPPAIAACLQDSRFLTDRTRAVYAQLAEAGCPGRLHGRGMQSWLAPGVSGVSLDDDDPLVDEWVIVVPGRVLFAATDLHEVGLDDDARAFRYAVVRDPDAVSAATRLLGL